MNEITNYKTKETFSIGDKVIFCTSEFYQAMPGCIQEATIIGHSEASGVKLLVTRKFLFIRWKSVRWVHVYDLWGKVVEQNVKEIAALERMMKDGR